ncbi:MAG TPA: hypothetical protein VN948_14800 [Terriglobales bacterium]|nr:hypothetical protein [Terriglobales bacterium]
MRSRIVHTSALTLATLLVFASTIWAQSIEVATLNSSVAPATHTLTITLNGTLGPILSGSDPLGLNGQSGKITVMASESLSPTKHTATSATYTLPAGAITVTAGSQHFTTKSPSKMIISLLSTADTLTLVVAGPSGLMATDTTFLKPGSWTNAVLKHPTVFKPSPQKLTSAKSASGPGCKVKYTILSSTTVLGFHGTGSNSATADPELPDDDPDQ